MAIKVELYTNGKLQYVEYIEEHATIEWLADWYVRYFKVMTRHPYYVGPTYDLNETSYVYVVDLDDRDNDVAKMVMDDGANGW